MEPSLSSITLQRRSLSHNGSLTLLLLLLLVFLFPLCQSQLISFKPQGTPISIVNNVFVLDSSTTYSMLLFGFKIANDTVVKWTESNYICNENEHLFGSASQTSLTEEAGGLFRAEIKVSFRPFQNQKLFYFCLTNEEGDYVHQGNSTWLQLIVKPPTNDILPLPVTIILIVILMCLSGLFSGLNLGLMSFDPTTLKIIMKSGTKNQKRYAKIIYRVRRHGNYLLCTLLLGNVLVNSTFTILLDSVIGSGIYAVIGSTLAIVIFGEIVPQAICSRYGLLIGAYTIWLTYIFMIITFPLSFPISLILNLILGKEIGAVYNRNHLLELLNVAKDDAHIDDYELDILSGALKFKDKHVSNIMTKFEHVFCVNIEDVLDFKTIKQIYDSGFSRIPIYEGSRDTIVGILHLRDLTFIDPEDCTPVRQLKDFYNRAPDFVFEDTKLEVVLKQFVESGHHMAIVEEVIVNDNTDNEYKVVGIVTLEDIIEEIIGREIVDEYDEYEDNVTRKKRKRKHIEDVGEMMYTTPTISLSAQQVLAVKQFLSSTVEPFQETYISKNILHRLLQQDTVFKISKEKADFYLYQPDVPANYFALLVEGCFIVTIGEEEMQFEARGFYYFGARALLDVAKASSGESVPSYIPKFKVSLGSDCLILIVTRRRYLAAFKASRFEEEHNESMLGDRSDVFSKEWKAAETVDLQASLAGGSGLTNITHLLKTKPLQGMNSRDDTATNSSDVSPVEVVNTLDFTDYRNHIKIRTSGSLETQV